MPAPTTEEALHKLVVANHILANEGVLDAFGHVSIRDPEDPGQFYIARSLAPEMVTRSDLQLFRFNGQQVAGDERKPYAERAIHAGVYEARADVLSICHNHSPSIIPFGVTGVPLRPIFHMAALLGTEVPVWEPSADFGETDMLVRTQEMGRSFARTLGARRVALMRGHGSVVAGATLREVVLNAIFMERNAQLQLNARTLGAPIRFLSDGEIRLSAENNTLADFVQERAWDAWERRVQPPG